MKKKLTVKVLGKAAFTGLMYGLVAKIWQIDKIDSPTEDHVKQIKQTIKVLGKAAFTGLMYGLVAKVWRFQ